MENIKKEIEAIIFLSQNPVSIEILSSFFNKTDEEISKIVKEIKEETKDRGINLKIKNNMIKFVSNPVCGEALTKFYNPNTKVKKLSKSSMETLTIIAFKGPMTKQDIEDIKGVSVDASVQVLLDKKLIYNVGTKKSVGNPKLYDVTEDFYAYVGLNSRQDLYSMDKAAWLKEYIGEENENK